MNELSTLILKHDGMGGLTRDTEYKSEEGTSSLEIHSIYSKEPKKQRRQEESK